MAIAIRVNIFPVAGDVSFNGIPLTITVPPCRFFGFPRILRSVWRRVNPSQRYAVRSMMKNLRRKLGDDAASPFYILTLPRVSYRMAVGEAAEPQTSATQTNWNGWS